MWDGRVHGACRPTVRIRARELDQRGRAGGVVVGAAAPRRCCRGARSITIASRRVARTTATMFWSSTRPRPGMLAGSGPSALEAVESQLFRDPLGGAEAPGRSGRSIRVVARELARELLGGRSVERGRQRRRRQWLGPADGERREKQRQGDEEPRSAHQAGVDRPLDRAAAWARVGARARLGGAMARSV